MVTIRTFIALELPDELKRSLGRLQAKFQQHAAGVKWTRPETIHLTLKFLGDINPDSVALVSSALDRTTAGLHPFAFEVAGIGAFPNSRNPKVLWAGMHIDDRLRVFQQQLEEALAAIGFAREDRPFAAHLTLGRLRDGRSRKEIAALLEQYGSEPIGRFEACRIIFYKSDLRPTGPVYTPLKEILLQSA